MKNVIQYGTISPEEKKIIFKTYMNYLFERGYDFEINHVYGDMAWISLTCSQLGLTLELELDSSLSSSCLMAHTPERSFMVNSLDYLMKETVEKTENITQSDTHHM